jgi:hypothetical protein
MKSKSGMKCTGLEPYAICDIISACHLGGVRHLKMPDVEIWFGAVVPRETPSLVQAPEDTLEQQYDYYNTRASQASGQVSKQKAEMPFDKELLEDLRTSQLMIDDPHGFENEMINSYSKDV